MIPAATIDALQPAQTAATGGRSDRSGDDTAPVRPVRPTGRALATQRDALLFRTEAILRQGGSVQAPYLAQQIGQLWPSPPPTMPKSAAYAYLKNSAATDDAERHASVLA